MKQKLTELLDTQDSDSIQEWRSIIGHESLYQVSSFGKIRKVTGELIAAHNACGYSFVRLKGSRKYIRIHRIVAEAFIPNPFNYPIINHKDNSGFNNRVDNLEWCNQKQNLAHMTAQGRRSSYWKGKIPPVAKLTYTQAEDIRKKYEIGNTSFKKLSDEYGVGKRSIGRIINKQSYNLVLQESPPPATDTDTM